ncbi:MAG: hypothetical protein IJ973_02080 [Christensenellaceae bacterium]|nr:hypothetical protein [Christensenellaceae bacterium]
MKGFLIKEVDNWLIRVLKAAVIVFIVLLSTLIACVQLSDLFNNIPEFENPVLSFIAVLLMICACRATMNTKKGRTAATIAFVVLSWPIVGVVQDSLLYLRQGYGILIEKENAVKQIGRLLIVSALALMPLISVCLRPILRKYTDR